MKKYLVMEIACHECGMGHHVVRDVYNSKDDAEMRAKEMEKISQTEESYKNYFSNEFEVVECDFE
jgi:uncharacterized membrane protein YjjP (DUF1212 family)